ncbi:DUF6531 domain-containing protein [Luteimonas fraxinea]|uniref:RHS repeat-associated core domain-containing protein n=1 Tax=Luteimonas fraxinea TaxID=2901869 RepID=UPI001E4EFC75|nr:RHS repeat-associated core domain-containing protein [Luteimonas fraxinea]UHH09243.1 DUF6531 domain-containing protein [Luteimonas fraxinea]
MKISSGKTLLMGLLVVCCLPAFAQSAPANNFCYGTACFPTKTAAETAMRQDPNFAGQGQFLRQTSQRIRNATTGLVEFRYQVEAQPAQTVSAAQFDGAAGVLGNGPFGCALAPGQTRWCASEAGVVNGVAERVATHFSSNGDICTVNNNAVTYDYFQNGSIITVSSPAVITFGERGYQSHYTCQNKPPNKFGFYVRVRYLATCAVGFKPMSVVVTQAALTTARMCVPNNSGTAVITGPLQQVASCKASPNPCHPTTGDKSRDEVDFVFAGRPFTRHYHSLNQIQQGTKFATGWSHTYLDRVEAATWGAYLWSSEGTFESFSDSFTSSGYMFGRNSRDTIMQRFFTGAVRFRLTQPDGDIKNFDSNGRLISVTNPQRPEDDVTVNYTQDRIASIVDARGRAIRFSYDSGRLVEVVKPEGMPVRYGYDLNSNLVSVDYGAGAIRQFHYAEPAWVDGAFKNHLTGITSEDGSRYASFGYDAFGRVSSSQLHAGSTITDAVSVAYTSPTTSTLTTANGDVRSFEVDTSLYRRITHTSDGGGSQHSTYDSAGRVVSQTARDGGIKQFGYHDLYVNEIREAVGTSEERRTTILRNPGNRLLTKSVYQSGSGSTGLASATKFVYTSANQIAFSCEVDPAVAGAIGYECGSLSNGPQGVRQTEMRYCDTAGLALGSCAILGQLLWINGPRTDISDTTSIEYYLANHPSCATALAPCPYRKGDFWKSTNALGHVSEVLEYDGAGRPLRVVMPDGQISIYGYNARGWLTRVEQRPSISAGSSASRVTQLEYSSGGSLASVTLPNGARTDYLYDGAQRLVRMTDAKGNSVRYLLDDAGNRVSEEIRDAGGALKRTLSRTFNALGQLTAVADASDNPTDFDYDQMGRLQAITNALGQVNTASYDALGRLKATVADAGGVSAQTQILYDALDQIRRVEDPKGLATLYERNGFGEVTQLDSPDTGISNSSFDEAGNKSSSVDARGQVSSFSYDALNRLTNVSHSGAPALDQRYVYDVVQPSCAPGETNAVGRLTKMEDGSGAAEYCFGAFGALVRKTQTTGARVLQVAFAHTQAGDLHEITYPDGSVVDYVRDIGGEVVEIGAKSPGGARQIVISDIAYAPFGPAVRWAYGNGRVMSRTQDLDYRIKSVIDASPGGLDIRLDYDANGRVSELGRATAAQNGIASFSYDGLGRLTAFRDHATQVPIEEYTYDQTGNRTSISTSSGMAAYTYEAGSHRLITVDGAARTYDAVGNTLSDGVGSTYSYAAANRLESVAAGGSVVGSYQYNGVGERVGTQIGPVSITTVYESDGRWLADFDTAGVPVQQAIWLGDSPVGVLVGSGSSLDRLHYVQSDHLGTPRTLIEPSRDLAVWKWDLSGEAFGNSVPNEDPDNDGASIVFNMRFPGQRYDLASGLAYNYFRDYEPATGRYTQSDPIGLNGGISTYAYSGSNPLAQIDPTGLACQSANGTTYCAYPGGPVFQVPMQPGWRDFNGSELLYHKYEVDRKIGCADPSEVMAQMIANPTPSGNARPATLDGTIRNDASIGPFRGTNFVSSYLTTDLRNGNPLVVNMTSAGSAFDPGYVARTVTDGVAYTYGEGLSPYQTDRLIWVAGFNRAANELIWGQQMRKFIDNCECR